MEPAGGLISLLLLSWHGLAITTSPIVRSNAQGLQYNHRAAKCQQKCPTSNAQIAPQLTARCLKRHQRNLTIPFSKNSFIAIGNARTPARCACNSRACMLRLYLREHNAYWCLSHAAVIYRLGDYRCQVFRVGRPASVHNAYMYYSSPACSRNGRSQKFQNEMK